MQRDRSDPLPFDPEPERTFRRRLAQQRLAELATMEGQQLTPGQIEARIEAQVLEHLAQRVLQQEQQDATRSLRDLTSATMSYDYPGSIAYPTVAGVNFELRPGFINMVNQNQYGGSALEDPHAHLERFIRVCNTFTSPNIPANVIRMRLFPFSLRDTAEEWLNSQPQGSITSWDDLAEKFTTKVFPKSLLRKMKNDIIIFAQTEAENLYESWERFKKLLIKCPQHNMSKAEQVARFYDGLLYSAKSNLDAAARGEFDALQPQAGYDLIEKMAARAMNAVSDRQGRKGVFEVEAYDQLMASNKQLSKQIGEMQKQMKEVKLLNSRFNESECVICGGPNCKEICLETHSEEEVKAMGMTRNDPYSNTYNQGWRNHPNFSWKDQGQGSSGQGGDFQKPYPNQRFQGQGVRQPQPHEHATGSGNGKKSLEEMVESFINQSQTNFKNHEAAIKNLENQFGQMAKLVSERIQGKFPSDTVVNPKIENASAITTRSGKVLFGVDKSVEEGKAEKKDDIVVELKKNKHEDEKKEGEKSEKEKLPFPNAVMKKNLEKQFSKFVSMFKKLHVDIPFSEVLEKMPQYAKFMKEILSKKRRLSEMDETVMMTEECNAIIQRKIQVKVKDLGSFTLLVEFEGKEGEVRALTDVEESINLMPFSMF